MIRDDRGRLLLESALLYPLIFLITVGAVLYGIGTGVRSVSFIQSDSAAARTAFAWDNSHRDPVTGSFVPGMYDDLYWRLTSDFKHSALARKKLDSGLASFHTGADKEGEFLNRIWLREVKMAFLPKLEWPDFIKRLYGNPASEMQSDANVTDPVEWVRNVDIARLYWPLIKNSVSTEEAEQMVEQFRRRPGAESGLPVFYTHDEARAYLQQLVHGNIGREQTEDVWEWRMIDARDSRNIAHQAYYGAKSLNQDTRHQLLKDAELLQKGKVKGVTWHFFRRHRDQSIGPNDALRRELEERGIVIVIHE